MRLPRIRPRFLPSLALLLVSSSCIANQTGKVIDAQAIHADAIAYPGIDGGLGERLYPGEQALAQEMAQVIEESIRKEYRRGTARRDAHPKAHGCVRAEFRIADTLPDNLSQGIFSAGMTYQAWIRFSNGSKNATRADRKGDARGMAIKVLDIPGKTLLDGEQQVASQDFILISHPVFFANDPRRYLSLIRNVSGDTVSGKLAIPFSLGLKGSLIALQTTSKKISNPLQTRYWSTVPYQLGAGSGRLAVKYSARACSTTMDPIPANPGDNFLRDALRATLQKGDACMEFLVQPRTSESMDIEDSMTEWKEADAPFYRVATIRISPQAFDTPEQNLFCENLAFNPWHALPEHKPLGATNRLRKVIYAHISRVRHEMNSAQGQKP